MYCIDCGNAITDANASKHKEGRSVYTECLCRKCKTAKAREHSEALHKRLNGEDVIAANHPHYCFRCGRQLPPQPERDMVRTRITRQMYECDTCRKEKKSVAQREYRERHFQQPKMTKQRRLIPNVADPTAPLRFCPGCRGWLIASEFFNDRSEVCTVCQYKVELEHEYRQQRRILRGEAV